MTELEVIVNCRDQGFTWQETADYFNTKYRTNYSAEYMRLKFRRLKAKDEADQDEVDLRLVRAVTSSRKSAAKARKESKIWSEVDFTIESVLDRMVKRFKGWEFDRYDANLPCAGGKKITLELILSDIHYGKLTDTVDAEEIRRRVRQCVEVTVDEAKRYVLEGYNVERLIVALVGDIIESATMHGRESTIGCEFGNSEQINVAVESLFTDVLLPLLGVFPYIHVPAVTGNHDRVETQKTFQTPGKEYTTWVIYHMLQRLCRVAGYQEDRITFDIPERSFTTYEVYGSLILYEHLDSMKAPSLQCFETLSQKRSKQLGKRVNFIRGGHWHQPTVYGRGEYIINGSVPGQDSYAEERGFDSEAVQTLVSYCETLNRPTPFFRWLPIYLGEKK